MSDEFETAIQKNMLKVKAELQRLNLDEMARSSGLVLRAHRKLSAHNLVLALLSLSAGCSPSLERIASSIALIIEGSYSKQALHKRMRSGIDHFIAQVITRIFSQTASPLENEGLFKAFPRVLLQDSTNIKLPDSFQNSFKGNSNWTGRTYALLKIQLVSDLMSGRIHHLSLSGFTRNDQAASGDILALAQKGDLVLRDLGYFVLKYFKQMIEQGVFFLSRYRHGVILLNPQTGKRIHLARRLRKQPFLDIDCLLGTEDQIPVRLICRPVPAEVANKRRRNKKNNRDRRVNPSREALYLLGWQIFITNVDRSVWRAEDLPKAYRLRWRIEIIFKAWKSQLKITELNFSSDLMLRLSIMTKLLFCALTHRVCSCLELLSPKALHASLIRVARILADCAVFVAALILNVSVDKLFGLLLKSHAFYEPRKDRDNFIQLATCSLG